MTRHPEIPRAAIAIAIWATAIVAWWVFDTPIQRHVERQGGPDVLVHVGLVVTALTFIAMVADTYRLDGLFLAWQRRARSYALLYRFTLAIRVLLAAGFVPTGMVKVLGRRFTTLSPEYPVGALFEALYQSGLYWQFIGWAQVIAGICVIVPATATLGALLFLPVMLSIFAITLSYDFASTPVVAGLMLLANVYLIGWDYDRLRGILGLDVTEYQTRLSNHHLGRVERAVYVAGAGSALGFLLNDRLGLLPPAWNLWLLLVGTLSACVAVGYAWTIRHHRVEVVAPEMTRVDVR